MADKIEQAIHKYVASSLRVDAARVYSVQIDSVLDFDTFNPAASHPAIIVYLKNPREERELYDDLIDVVRGSLEQL